MLISSFSGNQNSWSQQKILNAAREHGSKFYVVGTVENVKTIKTICYFTPISQAILL